MTLSARAIRGLEAVMLLWFSGPLLLEWAQTASSSARLSYVLLVPVLSLALALRSAGGAGTRSAPLAGDLAAACLALAATAALVLGTLSGVFTLSLLAVPLAVAALVGRWWGTGGLRRGAPALVLLLAMVPPPMPLMDRVNPALVEASGRTATWLLSSFDPAVSWIGSTLGFRGWNLVVADACSGSGTFLILAVLCLFLAGLFRMRPLPSACLVALSVPLALFLNGARIASSALLIDRFGPSAASGLSHELLGQALVIAGAAGLAYLVDRLSVPPRTRTG